MKRVVISFVLLVQSCFLLAQSDVSEINSIKLQNVEGDAIKLSSLFNSNVAVVFAFFSPECTMTHDYTSQLKKYASKYENENIVFYAVVSGKEFSKDQITEFASKSNLAEQTLLDPKFKLTKLLNASKTPEVFVVSSGQELVYSGAIDNWYVNLNEKREKPTEFYLQNALQLFLAGETIELNHTNAEGNAIVFN